MKIMFSSSTHKTCTTYCNPCQQELAVWKGRHRWIIIHVRGKEVSLGCILELQSTYNSLFADVLDRSKLHEYCNKYVQNYAKRKSLLVLQTVGSFFRIY